MSKALETASQLCERFEGYHKRLPDGSCTTYVCPAGVLTIGYGSTGPDIKAGDVWSRDQATQRLQAHLSKSVREALRYSPGLATKPKALGAIADFIYNLGPAAYAGSTLRRKVNAGDTEGAMEQIRRWNKGGGRVLQGLVIRREAEAQLLDAEGLA